jgi:uncharacterized protein
MIDLQARLVEALDRHGRLAIAVSGGVDSMTLAYVAHRFARGPISMVHACSPAVPASATDRVRRYAESEGWRLSVVDAGEFSDPSYRANPIDRCYFCKSCLYERIRAQTDGAIASGANVDDLEDYRPGLQAAAERLIVHPFIECGIGKAGIRSLAHQYGLEDLAELPAQPCLASRIETGIGIDADDLAFVDLVERDLKVHVDEDLRTRFGHHSPMSTAAALRCRITRDGVAIEVAGVSDQAVEAITVAAQHLCADAGRHFAGVRPYRRGSAFLKTPVAAELDAKPGPG